MLLVVVSETYQSFSIVPHPLNLTVGNDARKIIADGFPMSGVIASDLRQCKYPFEHFEDLIINDNSILGPWSWIIQVYAGIVPCSIHRRGCVRPNLLTESRTSFLVSTQWTTHDQSSSSDQLKSTAWPGICHTRILFLPSFQFRATVWASESFSWFTFTSTRFPHLRKSCCTTRQRYEAHTRRPTYVLSFSGKLGRVVGRGSVWEGGSEGKRYLEICRDKTRYQRVKRFLYIDLVCY